MDNKEEHSWCVQGTLKSKAYLEHSLEMGKIPLGVEEVAKD